ncbi:MAG: ribulokinase [Planctomycetota bacterium]
MKTTTAVLGLDFGTAAVRALVVDAATGRELGSASRAYPSGDHGVLHDPADRDVARQHPGDHLGCATAAVREALARARDAGCEPAAIAGIGVDTTGSTPLPVDAHMQPLALRPEFRGALAAAAWLWKDHSAHAEAAEITALARSRGLPYLDTCGGAYSSEWFWSKVLRCARTAPPVFAAAAAWFELCDFVPAWLCGITDPAAVPRSICAAGHKAMYHPRWGGLPAREFLAALHAELPRVAATFRAPAQPSDRRAGTLCERVAGELGLCPGIPVATGALDAHHGAVGSGCAPGTLVKILGTSTCDCIVEPLSTALPAIPGVAGIAPESILPGMHGIEAGQSAVGDIFHWFVEKVAPRGFGDGDAMHGVLSRAAAALRPGASGLLALDWHNGNRCVLADPRLSGLVLGLSLSTTAPELYRAWIEATAFGARMILDRLAEHGVRVDRIVTCGGVAEKNPLLMQIYADVLERPLLSARSGEACALGAAVFAAVVAGVHPDALAAQRAMTGQKEAAYRPGGPAVAIYRRLFACYRSVHDAFGTKGAGPIDGVMKELLAIRDGA